MVNAAADESYLGLDEAQLRALVQVSEGEEMSPSLCTGAFVAPDWVLTARHCLVIESPSVVVLADDGRPIALSVIDKVAHDSLDVALLEVAVPEDAALGFEPFATAKSDSRGAAPGDVVELAGYGLTEIGVTRELKFLAEPVVVVHDDNIVVDGYGANGACIGDSGGPLLMRDASGRVVIAGVLTSGSASCVGHDRYVRLDRIEAWLEDVTGGYSSSYAECGGIDAKGRCLYGVALHCSDGRLVADDCAGRGACGWDRVDAGFRCVEPSADPCGGVDAVGACRNGAPSWCIDGRLVERACDCGDECLIDGKTGGPRCGQPSEL